MKDLRKHEATGVHQSASKNVEGTSSITTYFACKRGPKREEAVVEAEVKFGYFLGEHHLALAVADHYASLRSHKSHCYSESDSWRVNESYFHPFGRIAVINPRTPYL